MSPGATGPPRRATQSCWSLLLLKNHGMKNAGYGLSLSSQGLPGAGDGEAQGLNIISWPHRPLARETRARARGFLDWRQQRCLEEAKRTWNHSSHGPGLFRRNPGFLIKWKEGLGKQKRGQVSHVPGQLIEDEDMSMLSFSALLSMGGTPGTRIGRRPEGSLFLPVPRLASLAACPGRSLSPSIPL